MKYKKTQKGPISMIVQQMKRRGGKVQGTLILLLRVRPLPNQAKRRRRNQINGTRVFRKKRWSDSLFPGERRLISLQYSGMLSISLRFHQGALATTTGLLRKTTTLHVHHAFLYISLPSLHDYDVKMPNCKFYGGRKQATTNLFFSL